jgi:hypothetical protein
MDRFLPMHPRTMANGEWRMQNCRRRAKFAVRHSPFNIPVCAANNFMFAASGGRRAAA